VAVSAKKTQEGRMADRADRHELYEAAVQSVDVEAEFLRDTFKALRGRDALSFREDFCGTASASCEWVKHDANRTAIGVDFDQPTLDWGRRHRLSRLSEAERARVKLLQDDVMTVQTDRVDIVGAFNFSYFTFKSRDELRRYFARAREALNDDGLFFLDVFGGSEAFAVQKEKTKLEGFTYIWDQAHYEPVTGRMVCHIHFKFPDGSKMKRAFSYEWRLWTLPELLELLLEAGFSRARVYWEGEDEDGEGNGEFTEHPTGTPDPAWIAYIVAER
jgi:hypothetical protein